VTPKSIDSFILNVLIEHAVTAIHKLFLFSAIRGKVLPLVAHGKVVIRVHITHSSSII
jgi:hypothetical protein